MTSPIPQYGTTAYKDFLKRVVGRIQASGGTPADAMRYLEHAERIQLGRPVVYNDEQPDMPSGLRGVSMNALQGLSFGFGDEALGGLLGLATGDGWNKGIDDYRAELRAFNQQNPKTALAGQIGGALMTGGVGVARKAIGGLASAATGALGKLGGTVATGAALGAVSGAGEGQGGIGNRALTAALGATGGAVLTAGATAIGTPLKALATRNYQARWVQRIQRMTGLAPEEQARNLVAEALIQSGAPIRQLMQSAKGMMASGAPVTLADIVDERAFGLALAAASVRSPAKQQVAEQLVTQLGEQGGRALDKVFTSLRIGLRNAFDAQDALVAQRSSLAEPLYQQAFKGTVTLSTRAQQLLQQTRFQQAYNVGRQMAVEEDLAGVGHGLPVPELTDDMATIPVRALDYMKRGLDVVIENASQPGAASLDLRHGIALRSMLNEVLKEAGEQVPQYAQARDIWRGMTDAMVALRLGKGGTADAVASTRLGGGRQFHQKEPDLIKRELAGLSPTDQAFYRIGAFQDLQTVVYGGSGDMPNVARRLGGLATVYGKRADPLMGQRLSALVPNKQAAQGLMDYLHSESVISDRARRQLTRLGTPESPALAENTSIPTSKRGLIMGAVDFVMNRSRTGWTEAVSDEVSSLFLKGLNGPLELQAALNDLSARSAAFSRGRFQIVAPLAGRAAGTVIGGQ